MSASSIDSYPRRIVCLTEETTETLYLLGEEDRIVGVSGYTVRPPEARKKPRISAFTSARYDRILELEPDLVLAFSDLQAEISRELIQRGVAVFTFNQRGVDEILQTLLTIARIVGAEDRGLQLVRNLGDGLEAVRASARSFPSRPRVFFEEWKDPLISGIRWVDELIEIAGGTSVFPELRTAQAGKDRIVSEADVVERDPQVVIGSWCGRRVNKDAIRARPGWSELPAVRDGHVFEIKSAYILQPGPAALTEGVRQIHAILAHSLGQQVDPAVQPEEKTDADL